MNQFPAFQVARARAAGRAVRSAEVRHRFLQEDATLLLLWQLGGEPFGVAAIRTMQMQHPESRSTSVMGDPRHRATFFHHLDRFAAEFNPWYLAAPRQLIVPNRATVSLLQRLAQRLVWLRDDAGNPEAVARLRVLGQIFHFLTHEAQRPGQSLLVVLTELLNAHWSTELSGVESANLAALDAAIDPGGRSVADAVLQAERLAIGPSPSSAEDAPVVGLLASLAAERQAGLSVGDEGSMQGLLLHYSQLFDPVERLCVRVVQRERAWPCSAGAAARWNAESERVWMRNGTAYELSSGDYFAGATPISVAEHVQAWEDAGTRIIAEEAIEDRLRQAALIASGSALLGNVVQWKETGELIIETSSPPFLAAGEAYYLCKRGAHSVFTVTSCRGARVTFQFSPDKRSRLLAEAHPAGSDIVLMQANPNADSSAFRLPAQPPWSHQRAQIAPAGTSPSIDSPADTDDFSSEPLLSGDGADDEPTEDRYP